MYNDLDEKHIGNAFFSDMHCPYGSPSNSIFHFKNTMNLTRLLFILTPPLSASCHHLAELLA